VRLALAFSENYAEPYVLLGDLYAHKVNLPVAEQCYLLALQKKINAGKVTTASYYEEIPAARLSDIALHNRELERALHFNKRAILHNEKEVSYIVKRKEILLKLINEYNTNYNLYGEI
jgi:hypothetical protein